MKIKIQGEYNIANVRQCVFEKLAELEQRFGVRHARSITLYLTPTNGVGDEVLCRDPSGKEITSLLSDGPYRPIADDYEI